MTRGVKKKSERERTANLSIKTVYLTGSVPKKKAYLGADKVKRATSWRSGHQGKKR